MTTSEPTRKVVITFARGWNALAAARSLGKQGIEVVTGDEYRFSPASFSRYTVDRFLYPSPDREPEAFLDKLEEVLRKHHCPDGELVLMPFHKETYLIARHRERFEPLCKMALPEISQIEHVHDKGTLARFCQSEGIPMPQTAVPESREEFCAAAADFPYPAFVKLRESAAAIGVAKVDSAEEAIEKYDEFVAGHRPENPPILQAGVPGDDYCSTFLFDHGEPRLSMTYRNLRSYPVKSGTGVLRETVEVPAIERIGCDLLAQMDWHGVAEVDFRWDGGEGQPWLIEVNPRFWGGLTQAVEAGYDYPHLLYQLAVNGHVDPPPPGDTSVRTETPVLAFLATLHDVVHDEQRLDAMKSAFDGLKEGYVKGNRRKSLRQFFHDLEDVTDVKSRWEYLSALFKDHEKTVCDVFKWRDPLPALGVFYPLAVFLKHGKVSTELLVSEGPAEPASDD